MSAAADPGLSDSVGAPLTLALASRIAPLLSARIEGLAERTPADLSFGNLWLFRRPHQWRWHDRPWPCISGLAYDGQRVAIPLFDVRNAPPNALHDVVQRHGALFPLCERETVAVQSAGGSPFELTELRDDADYVYPAGAFRRYRGRALQKKANLMAQLQAAHSLRVAPYAEHLRDDALAVLEGWMRDKGKAPGEADDEACREALALAPQLNLDGFVHWADGAPAGFVLAEELQPGVWVIRFAKGLVRFKGIAQYMFHHFACRTDARVDWLNFEQDLGLPGFRQTKLSYRPAFLLPKWRLRLRTG
ncbi:phosphatidylglycerol lysyltransferase domain-containing protein [Variovorax sp. PBL-H6]|uniref:phosphatidylglycerol lysyltransferase domain-containing protein n=1 Tax=Variovorax sp. PBL-H6 TaxID=434009 RepID=UPI0013A53294|nr:phosphatidylglycerol lysyltransferase domain-containing protein [Variovorax sp. PBL-H6]